MNSMKGKTGKNRSSIVMVVCCLMCVAALAISLFAQYRKSRLVVSVRTGGSAELEETKNRLTAVQNELDETKTKLASVNAELEARKTSDGIEESSALEKAWEDLANVSGELTSVRSQLENKERELGEALNELNTLRQGDQTSVFDDGDYYEVDLSQGAYYTAAQKLQYGKASPYSIPSGSVLAYDTDVKWLNNHVLYDLDSICQDIYRDEIVYTWKEENKSNLKSMVLNRIYFTQGRYRNQNNLIFAYIAYYQTGGSVSVPYYTYVGFSNSELVGSTLKIDLNSCYSPIAAWDSENSEGLGANYPVSGNTSVAGYASLYDLESSAIIEDSRNHWKYYYTVSYGD